MPPFAYVSKPPAMKLWYRPLAVRSLQLNFTGSLRFYKLTVRPLCEKNEVEFELRVLGDAFIM